MVNTEIRLIILFAAKDREALYSHLVCTRTQEKGAVTTQETDPDLRMSVRESQVETWSTAACCKVRATECCIACLGPYEGGHHCLHHLHCSLTSGPTTGREHSLTHQQETGLEIY